MDLSKTGNGENESATKPDNGPPPAALTTELADVVRAVFDISALKNQHNEAIVARAKEVLHPPDSPAGLGSSPSGSLATKARSVLEKVRERREGSHYFARARSALKGKREFETLDIELHQIATARIDNCRMRDDADDFKRLVESMSAHGQLNPVVVVLDKRNPGRFILIAGFRRLRAAAELGWKSIRASVCEVDNECDAYLINLAENAARRDISTCELAHRCQMLLARFGLDEGELAQQLGYTRSYIHNLIKYLNLPKAILDAWRDGHPLMTLPRLQRLAASYDPVRIWETMRSRHAVEESKAPPTLEELLVDEKERADDNSDGWAPFRRPSKSKLIKLRDTIGRQKHMPTTPAEFRKMALGIVDYARGANSKIPYVVISALSPRQKRRRKMG
jgi:ParB/RepB/Spo0J family partition protein